MKNFLTRLKDDRILIVGYGFLAYAIGGFAGYIAGKIF